MTHGYLIFRDVLQEVAEEEGAKLATPPQVLEEVALANRASCDSSIIWMTRAFDRQQERQAEASVRLHVELATSEARHRGLFESIACGVVVISPEGVVTAFNDAALTILRGTREQLLGARIAEIMARLEDEEGAPLKPAAPPVASSLSRPDRARIVKYPGSGRRAPIWLQVDSAPIFAGDGKLVEVVTSFVDVTAVKTAEALKAESEAKSRFLATMSHELRTPLNSIIGFSQLLRIQAGDALDDRQLRFLGHIESSGKNLLAMISDILELTKVAAGQITLELGPVEVVSILSEAVAALEPQLADKGLKAELKAPERLLARCDPMRCRQVVTNLLANAVKFTDSGGITVTAAGGGDVVEMVFADTGIGIPEEQLERVFDEFTQVDGSSTRAYGGTGLGLPLAKRLVELMSGRLTLTSVLGKGTTVRVLLPAATW
jgi:PAS domain S-box-containing protein